MSLIIGHYSLNVFALASVNNDNLLLIDFLEGSVESDCSDSELEAAITLFKDAFPGFCEKHGVAATDYHSFVVRYVATPTGLEFIVTIEDQNGKRSSREYSGLPGKRTETLDHLERRRPKNISEPMD